MLLIWPWVAAAQVTGSPLYRQDQAFVLGMTKIIKNVPAFAVITEIIAAAHGIPIGETRTVAQIRAFHQSIASIRQRCGANDIAAPGTVLEERQFRPLQHNDSMSRLINLFHALPRAENRTYVTLGQDGPPLENNDISTLGRDEGLSEAVISSILSGMDLVENVMVASAASYGRYYGDESFEPGRAAPIPDGIERIICPIHIGAGADHWVGVLVSLGPGNPRQVRIQLFDSSPMPTLVEQDLLDMVVQWIQHSLSGQPLQFPAALERVEVPHQEATNSCGVHMVFNLLSAVRGTTVDLAQDVSEVWVNTQRDAFLRNIIQRAINGMDSAIRRRFELEMARIDQQPQYVDDESSDERDKKRQKK